MAQFSIFLRPFKAEDYLLINRWRSDPDIQKMTGGPIRYVSLEIEREWVLSKMRDNTSNIYWAICLNDESERMVGYISLNQIDHLNKSADAGGTVIGDRDARDGYIIFEAMYLVLDYAFNQLNLNRITASCLPEHYMAPHSLYAFGFKKEGTAESALYKNGSYHNVDHYALLRSTYDELCGAGQYTIGELVKRCIKHIKSKKK
ncbi:uncharacterized protein BN796_00365 [Alistipes sp. CAG:831]|nr:uncharacterized protein BN796_00365 [Alistipes sp. CAG:831]